MRKQNITEESYYEMGHNKKNCQTCKDADVHHSEFKQMQQMLNEAIRIAALEECQRNWELWLDLAKRLQDKWVEV